MPSNQEVVISLKDIINIIKRGKKTMITSAVGFSLFTTWWTLTEPVKYMAMGTFSEKSSTQAGMSTQFSAALLGQIGRSEGSEASSAFKSDLILSNVAKKLNLQANLSEKGKKKPSSGSASNIPKNLKTAYYQWNHSSAPIFQDPDENDIAITSISYDNEIPYYGITLVFEDDQTFVLKDKNDRIRAHVGDSIATKNYQFKVERNSDKPLKGRTFFVSLNSLNQVSKNLSGGLVAKPSLDDKNLITISYICCNRLFSADVVNGVMDAYSDFLEEQHKSIANAQLAYLSKRQGEMNQIVRDMMRDHATKISSDLLTLGFPNAQSAMDFLSTSQAQQQQRALMIDLERMMLQKARDEGYSHFDNMTPHGDPGTINTILREIRELNKQKDNIQLTLQQKGLAQDLSSFHLFIEELDALKKNSEAAKDLLTTLEKGEFPTKPNSLSQNSKFLVGHWLDQLQQADDAVINADYPSLIAKNQIRETINNQFTHYLNQLIRLFDVHADIVRERMSLQQNPNIEYEGIELAAARELYLSQSKQIQELEAQTLQHHFIIENIQRPDFEVGSLSSFLPDGVSQQMIQQISQLSLQLTDYHNRSEKEKERLREEIGVKKGFLASHLKHSAQLLVLRQKLLKEKMRSLQETTLALIQQQISLLDKHLADYIDSRLIDLDKEYEVIVQHQRDLNKKMADLPIKWSDEQMIKQQMDLNKNVAGEVSRLIETKNLASNLELNRSGPMDRAFPPLKPISPRLPLFILIGLFMGTLVSVSFLLCRALIRGVPISKENLLLSGYNFSGTFSKRSLNTTPLLDSDLETLRAIISFLPRSAKCQTLLITEHLNSKYSGSLATLLSRQGFRVLFLDLAFDKQNESEGLLQYLEGKIAAPKIKDLGNYSEISAGGASRYGTEMVAHKRFKELLNLYHNQYDWVIASTVASPFSAEVKELRRHFDFAVLAVSDETQQQLPPADECLNVTFVIDGEL